jgi:transcriptional regulator with XRE-family HTH domain
MTVLERVLAVMEARGILFTEMATRLGVSQAAVSQWKESGKPPHKRLEQIANILEVSKDFLLTGKGDAAAETLLTPPLTGNRKEAETGEVEFLRGLVMSQQETITRLSRQLEVANETIRNLSGDFSKKTKSDIRVADSLVRG